MILAGEIRGPSKMVLVDGKIVERLSFKDSFGHHVAFVLMCCLDGTPFSRMRQCL
jgi:hypothetical protein